MCSSFVFFLVLVLVDPESLENTIIIIIININIAITTADNQKRLLARFDSFHISHSIHFFFLFVVNEANKIKKNGIIERKNRNRQWHQLNIMVYTVVGVCTSKFTCIFSYMMMFQRKTCITWSIVWFIYHRFIISSKSFSFFTHCIFYPFYPDFFLLFLSFTRHTIHT